MRKLWEKLVEHGIDWLEKIVEGIKLSIGYLILFNLLVFCAVIRIGDFHE